MTGHVHATAFWAAVLAGVVSSWWPGARSLSDAGDAVAFPGWPEQWDGSTLVEEPLTEREALFARAFPGRIARFQAGARTVILRWVTQPTRRLHAASDCFRGAGFRIKPQPAAIDGAGHMWARFEAERDGTQVTVRERIEGTDGSSCSTVSEWYWKAAWGQSRGPWWAITEVR